MDIKISDILSNRLNEIKGSEKINTNTDFTFTLNKISEKNLSDRLNGLIENITTTGKKLCDHMDVKDMKKYRQLISDFMNEIVTNSHKFSRENFLDSRGRHRVYGIVKKVDENLDELAQELLKSEKDNMMILDKTDEIRGLLLDLYI